MDYMNKIITIQKIIRGYLVRKNLKKKYDKFSFIFIKKLLYKFINYTNTIIKINKQLQNRKIRMPNFPYFPSEILENIAKIAIYKKYNVYPNWDINNGDLVISNKYIYKK